MKKVGLVLFKYGDAWVLPSQGRTPPGYTLHIEPVALVDSDDVNGLERAIQDRLYTKVPVPEPAPQKDRRSVAARALNLKSERVFHTGARAFYIHATPEELSLQEWSKAPGMSFSSPALWTRAFDPGDMNGLVWFLVKHETLAFPRS